MAKKQRYKVRNWHDYNKGLIRRGSLTLWFDEKSVKEWHKAKQNGRGRPKVYADMAILCMLTVKMVFRLPLRATQGLVESIINLLHLSIIAADYSTVCRRQRRLKVPLQKSDMSKPLHAVFDATGLKVFGEGEWKVRQHGYSKRRIWRKLHLGINEATGEIIAETLSDKDKNDGTLLPKLIEQITGSVSQVSGDGAYDNFKNYELLKKRGIKATIPTQKNAQMKRLDNTIARDAVVLEIRKLGRKKWKQQNGYHRRSLAETTMFRFKRILGNNLHAILFKNQAVEAIIKCNILNKMAVVAMPLSYAVK